MRIRVAGLALILLSMARLAAAEDVVFVVRHAERADAGMQSSVASDPPLSAAGAARAKTLASMLRGAEIERVFTSQFKRTQQTAQPLAAAGHVELTVVPAKDVDGLVRKIMAGTGSSLVVGHSDTVPQILSALGVKEKITLADDEYDNLFIVVRVGQEARLVRLRFQAGPGA